MNIKVESQGNRRIVRIEGKITFEHCPLFQGRLDSIIKEKGVREVAIDFNRVPFIDLRSATTKQPKTSPWTE